MISGIRGLNMKSIDICLQCAMRGNCQIRINLGDAWLYEPTLEGAEIFAICAYYQAIPTGGNPA